MLTSTVAVSGGILRRLPVIADGGIPKDKIWECLNVLYKIRVKAPVTIGGVIVENILNTGVNIVASRSMNAVKI
jgi:CxxC motif-containing protein